MRSDKSVLRSLFIVVLLLFASNTCVQGGEVDDVLKSIDPGDRKAANDDFLDETGSAGVTSIDAALPGQKDGYGFDAIGELDTIPRLRKEKEIAEKEREIIKTKDYDARMKNECWCVFNPCLILEAKVKDDLSADAKRLVKQRGAAYNKRANAKAATCHRWKEEGGASAEALYHQLETLTVQRDEERVIEERLKQQRIVDERRKLEAQRAAEKAEIASVKAQRERLRQEAAARHQEHEARRLDQCRTEWDQGRHTCGCASLRGAPGWVQDATTCEK